jgi:hypothetical protein
MKPPRGRGRSRARPRRQAHASVPWGDEFLPSSVAWSSYLPLVDRFGSLTFGACTFLNGNDSRICEMQLRRARRLSSERTMCHGTCLLSVRRRRCQGRRQRQGLPDLAIAPAGQPADSQAGGQQRQHSGKADRPDLRQQVELGGQDEPGNGQSQDLAGELERVAEPDGRAADASGSPAARRAAAATG